MKIFEYVNRRNNAMRVTVQALSREFADIEFDKLQDKAWALGIQIPRRSDYEVFEHNA